MKEMKVEGQGERAGRMPALPGAADIGRRDQLLNEVGRRDRYFSQNL
jgi:hypothetical protein